jgi:hypothetical protein
MADWNNVALSARVRDERRIGVIDESRCSGCFIETSSLPVAVGSVSMNWAF